MRSLRTLLFAAALLHGCLYALLMPPWQAPDEVAHYVYARMVADTGRLPVGQQAPPELDAALLASLAQHRAWAYRSELQPSPLPPALLGTSFSYDLILARWSLGHLPYAALLWPLRAAPLLVQLYAMRLLSVVMGACIVLLTYALARLARPAQPWVAVGAALFVLLLPQHAFIYASVNDGNSAALAATVVLWLLARLARRGVTWPAVAGVVLAAGYAFLSKATTYFIVPLIVVMGPWLVWRHWTRNRARVPGWTKFAVAGGTALLLAAIALPVALAAPRLGYVRQMLVAGARYWEDAGAHLAWLMHDNRMPHALGDTLRTFWANFGWVVVWLPASWYTLLFALTVLALVGWVVQAKSAWNSDAAGRPVQVLLPAAAASALGVLVAWFVASPDGLSYYQGRYLFGAIGPIAVLLVVGWAALLPARARALTPALVLVVMGVLDVAALFGVAVPYFYAW